MSMRAKMRLNKVVNSGGTAVGASDRLTFNAVTTKPFDADGASEDNTFARYTPEAELTMVITNPNLVGQFKEGNTYYLDFTEVVD